jgi:hypothetical protein
MNNEPVAWMDYLEHSNVYDLNVSGRGIPLYTHPAKELIEEKCYEIVFDGENYTTKLVEPKLKTLTDEEIQAIAKESYVWNTGKQEWSEIEFARAILRKAQEK